MNTYLETQESVLWGRALIVAAFCGLAGGLVYQLLFTPERPGWYLWLVLPLLGLIAANFWRMTVTVNSQGLSIGFGYFKKKIPLNQIVSCEPTSYNWVKYGGWGIHRWGSDGSIAYSAQGKTAVALHTPAKKYVITSPNPERLCQIISQFKKGRHDS